MTIRSRLALLITTFFVFAIGNGFLTFWLENEGEKKLSAVIHIHQTLLTAESYIGALKDAETGQRGFLLTEDEDYLHSYSTGVALAHQTFIELKRLAAKSEPQQALLASVGASFHKKLAELALTIELTKAANKSHALEIVLSHEGLGYMDDIRDGLSLFAEREQQLLEELQQDYSDHRMLVSTFVYLEVAVFTLLIFFTFKFLEQSLFRPLRVLESNAEQVERGEPLTPADLLPKGEVGQLISAFYDMGERVYEREQQLLYRVEHDVLTGAKNRTTLISYIDQALELARPKKKSTAVVFVDVNDFKAINDTFGHDVGDMMLKVVADRLVSPLDVKDHLFRIGGDEFVLVLSSASSLEEVASVLRQIAQRFHQPVEIRGAEVNLSVSMGVAIAPKDSQRSAELLEYADIAMFESKQDRQRAYTLFEPSLIKQP